MHFLKITVFGRHTPDRNLFLVVAQVAMHAENENFWLSVRQERHRFYRMSSVQSDELFFASRAPT
ncbi:MAG TPA: hypothetical protein DEB70_13090 [Planctomycetaceae bacterium]|nr:hypothetical protein [Planctomycetaceae bacterium]